MNMKLNIGGQKGVDRFPKGWTIVDVRSGADVKVDIAKSKLPFGDNSINAIYTSHTLEHIFPDRLPFVLSEFYRVLKPGMPVRVVVPNIDIAIREYSKKNYSFLKDKRNPTKLGCLPSLPIYFLSSWFFTYREGNPRIMNGHLNVFNKQAMRFYLNSVGFREISRKKYSKGSRVFRQCDFDRYKDCSLYMEAIK